MKQRRSLSALLVTIVALSWCGTSVQALVYDPNDADFKANVKFRKNVGDQTLKLATCFGKASAKCVKKADPAVLAAGIGTCSITDPNSNVGIDAKTQQKHTEKIAKCESKLDLTKKQPDLTTVQTAYTDVLGCPAADPNLDLLTYEDDIIADWKTETDRIVLAMPALCVAGGATGDGVRDCVLVLFKAAFKTIKGLAKCAQKCETDYKNTKGNGGPTDDVNQCTIGSTDANYLECRTKVLEKGADKAAKNITASGLWTTLVQAWIEEAIDDLANDLYNYTPSCP